MEPPVVASFLSSPQQLPGLAPHLSHLIKQVIAKLFLALFACLHDRSDNVVLVPEKASL